MRRTMISSLPSDLVMEILSWVPMNYLRELRLTCKQWKDLSKTKGFKKMHIGKASSTVAKEGESQMITMMNNNIYLTSILFVNGEPSFKHKGKLKEQVKVLRVYHCEGLLLCILKDDPRFLVWNPYLMEKRWIQPRYSHNRKGCNMFTYALGYEDKMDKSNRSCCIKLMRFIDYYDHAPECQFLWYEMYDFESGLWKTLDVTPHWRIKLCNRGVSLKGNTYWLAAKRNLDIDDCIICFDFTKERFGQLLTLPFKDGLDPYVTLSCVREEKLAVLVDHSLSNPYELWITTKIEAEKVSWTKLLTLDRGPDLMAPYLDDGFFIDEEKKIAMGFNGYRKFNIVGDAGYFKQLKLFGELGDHNYRWPNMCTYVPSLLQIEQPPGGGQRKQQSELEKRRFNENISRLVQVEVNHHNHGRYSRRFVTAEEYWVRLFPAEENQ